MPRESKSNEDAAFWGFLVAISLSSWLGLVAITAYDAIYPDGQNGMFLLPIGIPLLAAQPIAGLVSLSAALHGIASKRPLLGSMAALTSVLCLGTSGVFLYLVVRSS